MSQAQCPPDKGWRFLFFFSPGIYSFEKRKKLTPGWGYFNHTLNAQAGNKRRFFPFSYQETPSSDTGE